MKTLTCKELEGPCEEAITASTPEEMMEKGMEHIKAAHPEMYAEVMKMPEEEGDKWHARFMEKWAATPDHA